MDEGKLMFQDWLLSQVMREDITGRVAKKTLQIDTFARIENSYPAWRKLLASYCRAEDLEGLLGVWNEYIEARSEHFRSRCYPRAYPLVSE